MAEYARLPHCKENGRASITRSSDVVYIATDHSRTLITHTGHILGHGTVTQHENNNIYLVPNHTHSQSIHVKCRADTRSPWWQRWRTNSALPTVDFHVPCSGALFGRHRKQPVVQTSIVPLPSSSPCYYQRANHYSTFYELLLMYNSIADPFSVTYLLVMCYGVTFQFVYKNCWKYRFK